VEALQSGVVKVTGSTNSSGSYTITGLVPGTYDIRGTAGGFTPQTQAGLTVNSGATTTANFSLAVANPTAGIVYIYDELQRLKSVIDPVGEAATYSYDAVGNLLTITRNNATQTSVIDFNPNSGPIGSTVTIYGTGYSTTPSQNTVKFNGVTATVTASTLTQITATVPAGTTTGVINVTSPAGSANSSTSFVVKSPPSITSFTPNKGIAGTAVTITGTNFSSTPANNLVEFNRLVPATVSTSTTTSIQTTVPTGAQSGSISVTTADGTGESAQDFFITPSGYNTSDVDSTGRLTPGGSPLVMSVNTANHISQAIFDGVVGQRVSIVISNSTFPDPVTSYSASLKVIRPDGAQLGLVQWHAPNGGVDENFLDAVTLPITGTYTVIVFSSQGYTGQAEITLHNVPAELVGMTALDGTANPISITVPGQNSKYTFTANANDKLSGVFTAGTLTCCVFQGTTGISILTPYGTTVTNSFFGGFFGDGFMDAVTLPVSGTYTAYLNPRWTYTGTGTLKFYSVTDVTGPITPGGAAVPVNLPTPGQNARLTFTANAGDKISGTFTAGTLFCCLPYGGNVYIPILDPNGATVAGFGGVWGNGTLDTTTLPIAGTYTVLVNPDNVTTGNGTVQLFVVP
jgi:YD repeat-containing protein